MDDIVAIFDFLIGGGLIAGLLAATRTRSTRVITGQNDTPATARRGRRSDRAVVALWTLGAALVLLVVYNLVYFNSGANQVIGSPTRAQVTGTWDGDEGSNLVLRPNGTFTASALPQDVGAAGAVTYTPSESLLNPWSGHGTWIIGPGDFTGSPESVIFTVACAPTPNRCAGHARTFDLQAETNAPNGGGGPALFYYLGNTRDLNNQFMFVRDHAS